MAKSRTKSNDRSTQVAPAPEVATMFAILTEIQMISQLTGSAFYKKQDYELHMSHFGILNRLFRFGDAQTPQALAEAGNVTRATMTSNLVKLSSQGLVEVLDNPRDRRSKLVFLTSAGKKARLNAIRRVEPIMAEYAANLECENLHTLLNHLRELHHSVDPTFKEDVGY